MQIIFRLSIAPPKTKTMKMTEAKIAAAERGSERVGGERVVPKSEKEKRDIDERLSAYVSRPATGKIATIHSNI